MQLHHIGIVSAGIDDSVEKMKKIFGHIKVSQKVYDYRQDAVLCMLTLEDGTKIELIEGSKVQNYLKKRQFLYHTCWEVDNIENAIGMMSEEDGVIVVSEPTEAIMFDGRKVAFVATEFGLLELLERTKYAVRC